MYVFKFKLNKHTFMMKSNVRPTQKNWEDWYYSVEDDVAVLVGEGAI